MDIKISQLPEPKHIYLSDLFPVVNEGHTRSVTLEHLIYELEYLLEHMPHSTRQIAKDAKCQSNHNAADILELRAIIEQLKAGRGINIDLSKYYTKNQAENKFVLNDKLTADLREILERISTLESYHRSDKYEWKDGGSTVYSTYTQQPGDTRFAGYIDHEFFANDKIQNDKTVHVNESKDGGILKVHMNRSVRTYNSNNATVTNLDNSVLSDSTNNYIKYYNDGTPMEEPGSVTYTLTADGYGGSHTKKGYWFKPLYWWFGVSPEYSEAFEGFKGDSKSATNYGEMWSNGFKYFPDGDTPKSEKFYLYFSLPGVWSIKEISYTSFGTTVKYNVKDPIDDPEHDGYKIYQVDYTFNGISNSTIKITKGNGQL